MIEQPSVASPPPTQDPSTVSRRTFLTTTLAGVAVVPALAQQGQIPPYQSRDWGEPGAYPDRDIVALDDRFRRLRALQHADHAFAMSVRSGPKGPRGTGLGILSCGATSQTIRQLRWIEDDNRVTEFRSPSGHSNGNTFDHQGRQLSCEHGGRRVARYEHNGDVTVVADRFEGKRLNSPNDVVVHPDGGVWFTDPPYGIRGNYEGFPAESELPNAVYRVDPPTGMVAKVTDEISAPNGLCFSPGYDRLYVADTGAGRDIKVWDVDGTTLRNPQRHIQLTVPGTDAIAGADGIRSDVDGNIWAGAGRGVQVVAPDGEPIGLIRLPEICANVCFGGARRNRLFMTASQSLYSVYVGVQGAGVA